MRKQRKFKIEGHEKSVEVYELSVRQIIGLMEDASLGDSSLPALKSLFVDKLLPLGSNLSYEELVDMYPSEIKECWEKFREVNASFFDGLDTMGLTGLINTVKVAIIKDFSNLLVSSSRQDTPTS